MKNLYNSTFKKANSLLKKLVLLLLVQYVFACHTITVTKKHFTCCSVVLNVMFNTCFGSTICYTGKFYIEDFSLNCHLELSGKNCMKIIDT
jgi:hypothetical protein